MRLELLAKDKDSGRTGCPSVLLDVDADGMAVVWADTIDSTTAAAVPNHLPGESGVQIKMDTLVAAVAAYQNRR